MEGHLYARTLHNLLVQQTHILLNFIQNKQLSHHIRQTIGKWFKNIVYRLTSISTDNVPLLIGQMNNEIGRLVEMSQMWFSPPDMDESSIKLQCGMTPIEFLTNTPNSNATAIAETIHSLVMIRIQLIQQKSTSASDLQLHIHNAIATVQLTTYECVSNRFVVANTISQLVNCILELCEQNNTFWC
jgi:hypothetical protein